MENVDAEALRGRMEYGVKMYRNHCDVPIKRDEDYAYVQDLVSDGVKMWRVWNNIQCKKRLNKVKE